MDNHSLGPAMSELKTILSVNAIMETLAWWLRQRKPLSPERVACILEEIIALHDTLGVE